MKRIAFILVAFSVAGCTDTQRARIGAIGDPAHVTCYSGGQVIFEDDSTGRVEASESGGGLFFNSAKTDKLIRTYADCVVVTR